MLMNISNNIFITTSSLIAVLLLAVMTLFPGIALAQSIADGGTGGDLGQFGLDIVEFINDVLVPFVFAVALLLFIYGVFLYFFLGGGDDEKRKTGKNYMLYGIGAFVVMVSVWGIVNLIAGGLGFNDDNEVFIPRAGETSGGGATGRTGGGIR